MRQWRAKETHGDIDEVRCNTNVKDNSLVVYQCLTHDSVLVKNTRKRNQKRKRGGENLERENANVFEMTINETKRNETPNCKGNDI